MRAYTQTRTLRSRSGLPRQLSRRLFLDPRVPMDASCLLGLACSSRIFLGPGAGQRKQEPDPRLPRARQGWGPKLEPPPLSASAKMQSILTEQKAQAETERGAPARTRPPARSLIPPSVRSNWAHGAWCPEIPEALQILMNVHHGINNKSR